VALHKVSNNERVQIGPKVSRYYNDIGKSVIKFRHVCWDSAKWRRSGLHG